MLPNKPWETKNKFDYGPILKRFIPRYKSALQKNLYLLQVFLVKITQT